MYESTSDAIRVRVNPEFLEDQSEADDGRYFWAYTIEITNTGRDTVQLVSRLWHITDANGRVEVVRGAGVIGQQPVLGPGESFSYTSGCPLRTPSGVMVGTYTMMRLGGGTFDVAIPAFSLDSPYTMRVVN